MSDALHGLLNVASLAAHAEELDKQPVDEQPYCLRLLLDVTDAAWLFVNLRQEIKRYRDEGWEPSGHYALHLAHRTLDVLLGGYLGFQFALGRDKPESDPHAVSRAVDKLSRYLHVANYLGLMLKVADHDGAARRVHPAYERILDALGGAAFLRANGVWKVLNEHRNDGVMGHGRTSLEQFAESWATARAAAAEQPRDGRAAVPVSQGEPSAIGTPSQTEEHAQDREVTPAHETVIIAGRAPRRPMSSAPPKRQQAPTRPERGVAHALDDYVARLTRLGQCCQGLAHSADFDDRHGRELLLCVDWPRLEYCTPAPHGGQEQ